MHLFGNKDVANMSPSPKKTKEPRYTVYEGRQARDEIRLKRFREDFSRGVAEVGGDLPFGVHAEDFSGYLGAVLQSDRADDLLYLRDHGRGKGQCPDPHAEQQHDVLGFGGHLAAYTHRYLRFVRILSDDPDEPEHGGVGRGVQHGDQLVAPVDGQRVLG